MLFVLSLFVFIEFVDLNFDGGIGVVILILCKLLNDFEYLIIVIGFFCLEKVVFFINEKDSVVMDECNFFSFKVFFKVDFL